MMIVKEILAEVQKNGFLSQQCYVGITNDPDRRLKEHQDISKLLVCIQAVNVDEACEAEHILITDYGFRGSEGGNAADSVWVYCYKVATPLERIQKIFSLE